MHKVPLATSFDWLMELRWREMEHQPKQFPGNLEADVEQRARQLVRTKSLRRLGWHFLQSRSSCKNTTHLDNQ